MCIYVCICVCMCAYMCVYVCICVLCIIYIYVYVCICVCICAYMCVYVCVYVCICVHMCIYKCAYVYVYIYVYRRGFASRVASCAYPSSRWMMGSTCSVGSDLGVAPLGSNDLPPIKRSSRFCFCAWMAMHASRVLESFPYGVVEKFSKATLVLYSWYDVL
jgi:hypothetical protein